jgi:hypothetical protein
MAPFNPSENSCQQPNELSDEEITEKTAGHTSLVTSIPLSNGNQKSMEYAKGGGASANSGIRNFSTLKVSFYHF